MNSDVKQKWIAALRSGKYGQGTGALRSVDGPKESFCCLGVLCDIANAEGVVRDPDFNPDEGHYVYGSDIHTSFLPYEVREWSGVDSSDGEYFVGASKNRRSLVEQNDNGHTFAEIADIIEREF